LYEIIDALDRVESGNFDLSLDIRSGDEFERIGESFNTMTSSIRELLRKERSLAEEQLTTEMQVMESQFNPRFLMNSLDAIRYLIRLDPDDASQMTVSLSRLLQYSISYEDEMVPLDQEIDFITRYFQFIRYRYGQRLKYSFEIDDACLSCVVPRMILQPLVEVSMRYGLREEDDYLSIVIGGRIEGDKLLLTVCDDSDGISETELNRLNEALLRVTEKFSPVGAYSINKRVVLLYGEDYGLTLHNKEERGICMTLTLPRILDVSSSQGQSASLAYRRM
ncbi:MAG: histidine kinase, partial [Lachnospiraceae bacterium]|nr:histidine kinase [Lachnospiraceae bacterium]